MTGKVGAQYDGKVGAQYDGKVGAGHDGGSVRKLAGMTTGLYEHDDGIVRKGRANRGSQRAEAQQLT